MKEEFCKYGLNYLNKLQNSLNKSNLEKLYFLSNKIYEIWNNDNYFFICGNGGSAADSQHLSAELIGRFSQNRKPLRAIALTTDSSVLTCISNDFSYDDIFSRQIEGLASKGDVLIAISTSGDSTNIIRAIESAKHKDVFVVGLLGKNGGLAREISDLSIVVPSFSTARIQEGHILIGHIICDLVERQLGFA